MPRPRTLVITFLAIIAVIIFARSSSSSDRSFYDNTVERLHLKHEADQQQQRMGTGAVNDAKLREAAKHVQAEVHEAAEERRKKEDGTEPGALNDAQKPMGGAEEAATHKDRKPYEAGAAQPKWTDNDKVENPSKDSKAHDSPEDRKMDAVLNEILKHGPIIVFSKTYCPFSKKAKSILGHYKMVPKPFVVEVDLHELGPQIQDKLLELTGRRTVPNVLVMGKSIGGGDDIQELHEKGTLIETVKKLAGTRLTQMELR